MANNWLGFKLGPVGVTASPREALLGVGTGLAEAAKAATFGRLPPLRAQFGPYGWEKAGGGDKRWEIGIPDVLSIAEMNPLPDTTESTTLPPPAAETPTPSVSPDLYARADRLAGGSEEEKKYQEWLKNRGPVVAASTSETMPQGEVRRGPRGELLLTNLADAGKELAYNDPGTMPSQTLNFQGNLNSGAPAVSLLLNPTGGAVANRGMAGFSPGAPDPTETSWDEVRTNPAYSQLQKEHWIEANQAGLPLSLIQAQIGEAAAQAEMARRQGGLFEEQAGSLRRQTAQTPLERALEQTTLGLEKYIEDQVASNPNSSLAADLDFRQRAHILKLLEQEGRKGPFTREELNALVPPGSPIERAARRRAIQEMIQGIQPQLQEAQIKSGLPLGG